MDCRPVLVIQKKLFDRLLEATGWIMVVLSVGVTSFVYSKLPESVPAHYNIYGVPDRMGSKLTVLFLPVLSVVMYVLLYAINHFPHKFNYLKDITEENAEAMYSRATRFVRLFNTIMVSLFAYLTWTEISIALGQSQSLNMWIMGGFLILNFSFLIGYLVKAD